MIKSKGLKKLVDGVFISEQKMYLTLGILGLAFLYFTINFKVRGLPVGENLYPLAVLFLIQYVFKLPERISEIGGMTIEMVSTMLVAAMYGPMMAFVFALSLTVFGNMATVNLPQTIIAESLSNALIGGVLAGYLISIIPLTPANFVVYTMAFVIARHIIGVPIAIMMGCPAASQIPFGIINTIWNAMIVIRFGNLLWGLFI